MANYVLGIYDANTGTFVRSGELQVSDATPLPVTAIAGATSASKAEDAAHTTGDTGGLCLAVRRDAADVGSDTDGDYSTLNVDSTGNLWSRIGVALPAGNNNIGDVDVASIAAGTNHIGAVNTPAVIVELTPVCDTSAYTAGDVLFTTTELPGVCRASGTAVKLTSVSLLDEDDNTAAAITLFFLRANSSLGAFNNAPDIDDTEARDLIGYVSFAAGDFIDLGANKFACLRNLNLILQPTTGTSLYVAATCAGTPTQTASGIKLRFGFERY